MQIKRNYATTSVSFIITSKLQTNKYTLCKIDLNLLIS